MSAKGLEVIDHSAQLTHEWVNELTERLGWSRHRDALRLLRVTLTGIRDHIGHDELVQFGAQLPLLIRGMYYEGWKHSATPVRGTDGFFEALEKSLSKVTDYRGPVDVGQVFALLDNHVSRGELDDVRSGLPKEIRELWPTSTHV